MDSINPDLYNLTLIKRRSSGIHYAILDAEESAELEAVTTAFFTD